MVSERTANEIIVNKISPSELEAIAKKYGFNQVILIARTVGEKGAEHCVTYGTDRENSVVAEDIGNFMKFKVMGWKK